MNTKFAELSDSEVAVANAATELAREQLLRAVSIVSAVTGRDLNDVDTRLVGAVTQALATNQLAIVMGRRDFTV
jgi:hypothetical protein